MKRTASFPRSIAVAFVTLATVAVGHAQPSAPTWVVGDGIAYVEAYRFPDTMEQVDTAFFLICEPSLPGGIDVLVWFGRQAGAPRTGTIEVLTRRDQDAPRRSTWQLYGDGDRAHPLDEAHLGGLVADVIDGGDLAVRVIAVPGLSESAQPTFQYALGGVESLVAALPCLMPGTEPSSQDPFALAPASPASPSPVPARPSAVSPRSGTAPPVAPPRASGDGPPPSVAPIVPPSPPSSLPPPSATVVPHAPAPPAPPAPPNAGIGAGSDGIDPRFHPVTDLMLFQPSLAAIAAFLPPRVRVATSQDLSGSEPTVSVYDARGPGFRALVLGCGSDGSAVGIVASPALVTYGDGGVLWFALFAGDEGLGEARIGTIAGLLDGTGGAVLEYVLDALGIAAAIRRYGPELTVAIADDNDVFVDAWSLDVSTFRTLVDDLPCMNPSVTTPSSSPAR